MWMCIIIVKVLNDRNNKLTIHSIESATLLLSLFYLLLFCYSWFNKTKTKGKKKEERNKQENKIQLTKLMENWTNAMAQFLSQIYNNWINYEKGIIINIRFPFPQERKTGFAKQKLIRNTYIINWQFPPIIVANIVI